MRVLFYISGHGFGHATRVAATMGALLRRQPAVQIHVRTPAPESLFAGLPSTSVKYSNAVLDAGVVEKDLFSQDIIQTLTRLVDLDSSGATIVSREVEYVKSEGIDVIVSDVPPLASEVGSVAGVRTMAIANFSWDFIYAPYFGNAAAHSGLLDRMRESYSKTDLLLRLPFHHDMTAFPKQRDIPLVARKATVSVEEVRARLRIADGDRRKILLVALRMPGAVPARAIHEVVESGEFVVLSFAPLPSGAVESVRLLGPEWRQWEFPDVVQACDLVLSKLGYGIVSDCIAARTPLIYIPRDDFAEYELLKQGINGLLPSYLMPREDFLQGRWLSHVRALARERLRWSDVRTDGAEIAAEAILAHSV